MGATLAKYLRPKPLLYAIYRADHGYIITTSGGDELLLDPLHGVVQPSNKRVHTIWEAPNGVRFKLQYGHNSVIIEIFDSTGLHCVDTITLDRHEAA